jgi:hypothetical protein
MAALWGQASFPPDERGYLERVHHELCTGLTMLRLNVELVRIALRDDLTPDARDDVSAHLLELEKGFDRLERLARELRQRHSDVAA